MLARRKLTDKQAVVGSVRTADEANHTDPLSIVRVGLAERSPDEAQPLQPTGFAVVTSNTVRRIVRSADCSATYVRTRSALVVFGVRSLSA
jgi:hypothetical protein